MNLRGRAQRGLLASVLAAAGAVVSAGATIEMTAVPPAGAVIAPGSDDTVMTFGTAGYHGSTSQRGVKDAAVAMAGTPDGNGYWIATADGRVYAFGSAPWAGSLRGTPLSAPIIGIAAAPDGRGYWLVGGDGGVFTFGSAKFYGSTGAMRLNSPILGLVPVPDGGGYWLYAGDGGVFTFGSAKFYGSTGAMRLNAPVVGMAGAPGGKGYWLVARDGGVFTFGSAKFHGSTGGLRLNKPVVGLAATGTGRGYWLAAEDGGVFAFGNAAFRGSAAGTLPLDRRVAQITALPHGQGYRMLAVPIPRDVVLMGPGASGPDVLELQNRLFNLGYWVGTPEGSYGLVTQQAVYAFQKVEGLPRTGRVDVGTQLALRDAVRPATRSTSGYVIEVDKARQVIIVARNGHAEWVINTSTGTERPYTFEGHEYLADTPVGQFSISSQIDGIYEGRLGRLYRPKFFHPDGIAFHGYTSVPPYPASHGCVRMSYAAMDWVWASNVMPRGTSVWVY